MLGDPVAPQVDRGDGSYQVFENGVITYSSSAKAHEFHGDVYTKWRTMTPDQAFGRVGYATSDGDADVTFGRAEIIVNPGRKAAFIVEGGIWQKFTQKGGIATFGLPKSDMIAGRGGDVKKMNWFEQGAITWGAAGVFAVKGGIYQTWMKAGSERSRYGGPISDESTANGAADQKFSARHYVIDYRAGRPLDVSGAVGAEYVRRGMAGSDLGYPLAAMTRTGGAYQQNFLNGNLKYTSRVSVIVNPRFSSHTTTAAETRYTYRSGCPVAPSQLTTTQLNYYNFDGKIVRGTIITRSGAVTSKVQASFRSAGQAAFPIHQITNPDYYKGDDPTQMNYDNTSAFNCRKVTGSPYSTSPHSYGVAVDINTFENPYQDSHGKWWPTRDGAAYWRTHRTGKGVLTGSDPMTKALVSRGAFWGARWVNPDYQHFEWD